MSSSWVYPAWNSLCFLDLVDYFFPMLGKFSQVLSLSSPSGTPIMWMLVHLMLPRGKPLTVWNCGKFFKRREYQTTWPTSWEICIQVKKQQLELDMEQTHGIDWFQIGKGCILSPYLFNLYAEYIMRNARLDEAQLESRLSGEISVNSDMQMTSPLWQKTKRN